MPVLVDTGAMELLRRRDRWAETLSLRYYPPVTCVHVVGEFLFGQANGKVSASTYQEAEKFLESFEVLQPRISTAVVYSRLKAELGFRGIRLPDPDYGIASHA